MPQNDDTPAPVAPAAVRDETGGGIDWPKVASRAMSLVAKMRAEMDLSRASYAEQDKAASRLIKAARRCLAQAEIDMVTGTHPLLNELGCAADDLEATMKGAT